MNVLNALRGTCMVILITCNGTQFMKKQTELSCPRMLVGPHVANTSFKNRVAL